MIEQASTISRCMIETLLHVHALTNMHRSSGEEGHREAAIAWMPQLESQLIALKRELEASPLGEQSE